MLLNKLNIKSETVNNAVITIGSTDNSGKGKHFKSRFIQAGLVKIENHGIVLLRKETIDNSLKSMIGSPVIIKHQDVTNENANDLRCGVISDAYFNEEDGWYYAEGVIWDEEALGRIQNGWSVSCSYDFTEYDDVGGVENNIKYDKEFTKLNFTHLALVDNPRYERANIVFNCKVDNLRDNELSSDKGKWITINGNHIFIRDGQTLDDVFEEKGWNKEKIIKDNTKNEIIKRLTRDIDNLDSIIEEKDAQRRIWTSFINDDKAREKAGYDKKLLIQTISGLEDEINTSKKMKEDLINKRDEKLKEDFIPQDYKENTSHYGDKEHLQDMKSIKSNIKRLKEQLKDKNLSEQRKKSLEKRLKEDKEYFKFHKNNLSFFKNKDHTNNLLDMAERALSGTTTKDDDFILEILKDENDINNSKEQEMALLDELKKLISKVENEKGEPEMDEKEKVDNKKVDKRKLIDEVGGILKGKVDDEIIRTVIKKMEEASYNGSEDSKADNEKDEKTDNCGSKVKNEDKKDKEKVEEIKEDVKEDIDNKCGKKVENSKTEDYSSFDKINEIYNSVKQITESKQYESKQDRLDNAVEYFK